MLVRSFNKSKVAYILCMTTSECCLNLLWAHLLVSLNLESSMVDNRQKRKPIICNAEKVQEACSLVTSLLFFLGLFVFTFSSILLISWFWRTSHFPPFTLFFYEKAAFELSLASLNKEDGRCVGKAAIFSQSDKMIAVVMLCIPW